MAMGDAWGREPAPVESTPTSVEYFRQKAIEFQQTLNAVDRVAQESLAAASVLPDGPEREAILAGMSEFDAKRASLKVAAEGINAGAFVWNTLGGRFPVLSIPRTLGLPVAIPAATAAAFAVVGSLTAWAIAWARVQSQRIGSGESAAEAIEDPQTRAEVLGEIARIKARAAAAAQEADGSIGGALASLAKWGGIAVLAYFAWRMFDRSRS